MALLPHRVKTTVNEVVLPGLLLINVGGEKKRKRSEEAAQMA